ncbi:hypothetical protein EXS79_07775 [Helicobacter pylori]|nr:hypothetical protein [Helicobacter pylori]
MDFNIRDFIHWNAFVLEYTCIGMYLEYYSIKRFFFFCHFLKNFVIFLILTLFVSFGGVKSMVRLFS